MRSRYLVHCMRISTPFARRRNRLFISSSSYFDRNFSIFPDNKKEKDNLSTKQEQDTLDQEKFYTMGPLRIRAVNVNLPNALTIARILASPPLSVLYLQGYYKSAFFLFMSAGACDFWDGYLARKWNQQTVLGAMLDPVSDKILVAALALPMAYDGTLPIWLVTLIIGRDVGLVAGGFWHRFRTKQRDEFLFDTKRVNWTVEPTFVSKCNTAGLIALVSFGLTNSAFSLPGDFLIQWMSYGVGCTTAWSAVEYINMFVKNDAFKDRKRVD